MSAKIGERLRAIRRQQGLSLHDVEARSGQEFKASVLGAYELCLKCSHLFNILDARGAISVTERVGVIARVRALAVGIAKAWVDQQTDEPESEEKEPEPAVEFAAKSISNA